MPEASELETHASFLSAFLRAPISTGAIAPSSRGLARRMVEDLDLESARTVVEVGPGTGSFTGSILAASPRARVLAVEINGDFATRLRTRFPRLHVVHDSVEQLPRHLADSGLGPADVVLCGLPWAILDTDTQRRLLDGICRSLGPGGRFATFGYVHCTVLPWSRHFRRLLRAEFSSVRTSQVVWKNLPPAFVYRCRR